MSAFLGPIHSLMYNRIITLQQVINALADLSKVEGWNADVDDYVIQEFPPIEEVVDLSNIHASLFGMVDGAEKRFAGVVSAIARENYERLEKIEATVKSVGESMKIEGVNSPEEACARLQEILLDGMPCDRASMVNQYADGSCEIIRTMDLHSSYFEEAGLDGDLYYQLLKSFVTGLFADSEVKISGDVMHTIAIGM
ncbi:hypothetical protein SAMN05421493_10667 [Pseudobutyrivibrio sp. 49]|uniref:hypothetical protein n=1 Tax=Pseudobutyrivibrio sp. 49 TaxID=1855344 RepID=UPI000882FD2D|nr:hypothetical protein [Pseudobutyrivibrio sp. 49]SDH97387.1 hypothetical protein SAMN05421493_10667 [Pseudobutyrivibrio sp. 49]